MGIISKLEQSVKTNRPRIRTGYAAAEISRLTSSLVTETEYINKTLRYQLRALRARSRQAVQNNPFARRFVQMVVDNVAGPEPFRLQAKVKNEAGKLDAKANINIERNWRLWGKMGNCEISGRFSWNATQRLIVRTLATDGEVLIRKHRGRKYGAHQFKLQLIDMDRLDEQKNLVLKNGNAVHMGIEINADGAPQNYYIMKRKPAQWERGYVAREYDVIPASEILHLFIPDFTEQVRGVPWMYAALLNLVHIGAFEEAALIAGRVGASQMGFIQSPDGGGQMGGDDPESEKTDDTNPQIEAEPGFFQFLPPGYEVHGWNPKYPDAAVEPFLKNMLRGVASGLGVAYHNLASDMSGVNYTSSRTAELDERDLWTVLQQHVIEHAHEPIYKEWLPIQVMKGNISANPAQMEKYLDVKWQARRWQWVDPLKETKANVESNAAGMKSKTRIIAESGEDIEDVFKEMARENELAEEYGLTFEKTTPNNQEAPNAGEEETD